MTVMTENSGRERKCNIWAPWRMPYIETLHEDPADDGCFLCRGRDQRDRDVENLVLWRGEHCLAVLNRYPYTGGHSMVAPLQHVATMGEMPDPALLEMMRMVTSLQDALKAGFDCQGFNVGFNIGRCAGAGLPGHLHVHVVPRWNGDTNFMPVFTDVRVVPVSLEEIYEQLSAAAAKLDLPWSRGEMP